MFLVLSLNRHKTVPSAAVTAIFVLAGCSARKPIAPPYAPFRLESVRGDSVLLTPPIPQGKNECALVKLTLKSSPAPSGVHCSAERGHFRVEHAYFRPAEEGEEEHTAKLFLGVSTAYFNLQLTSDGRIRFRQNGTAKYTPPSLVHGVHDEISDLAISSIPQERYFRLLFKTYLVPQKHTRSTAIIGATKSSQLDELDKELRAHLAEDCKNTAAIYGAVCFGFEGFVTLTPQVKVELNGKTKFIDSGTRIKDLLSRSQADGLKSLKIQRQFLNSYYDLQFDPADPNVLSLALVARDRVTWSNSPRALH